MSRRDYSVFFVPVAVLDAANVVMAIINGDNPTESNSFSVGAVAADGPANGTITHRYGGTMTTPAWLASVAAAADTAPSYPGGWPVTGMNGPVSEADALAAAQEIYVNTATKFDGTDPDEIACLAAALSSLSLKPWDLYG